MARIFISYSRKDELFARKLATSLSEVGADVWIDVEDIPAGMNWSAAIQEGLNFCEVMIVILSPSSTSSVNVDEEWQFYRDRLKLIFPVLLEKTEVHYQLSRIQYINFLDQDYDTAFRQLQMQLIRKGLDIKDSSNGDDVPFPKQEPLPVRAAGLNQPLITPKSGLTASVLQQSNERDLRTFSRFERWYLTINGATLGILLLGFMFIGGANNNSPVISTFLLLLISYLALAAVTLVVINMITNLLNIRSKLLVSTIKELIPDPVIQARVLAHPQINLVPFQVGSEQLSAATAWVIVDTATRGRVTSISPQMFANVMIEALLPERVTVRQVRQRRGEELVALLTSRVNDPELTATLESILGEVETLADVQIIFAAWYETAVRRSAGVHTRSNQYLALMVSLILAILLNVDTTQIVGNIFGNAGISTALSATLSNLATTASSQIQTPTIQGEVPGTELGVSADDQMIQAIAEIIAEVNRPPLGWRYEPAALCYESDRIAPFECSDAGNLWLFFPGNDPNWFGFLLRKIVGLYLTVLIVSFFTNIGLGFTRAERRMLSE